MFNIAKRKKILKKAGYTVINFSLTCKKINFMT